MPVPIIARQRALSQIGEIRCGGEKAANAPGKKLETFRLTSQQQEIIATAAGLYGGKPEPWDSPTGPAWQLYTEASSLPCMVIVGYSLTRQYELWEGASKRVRVCDGVTEQFTDGPCICNTEGNDRCDTITRLMVMLPETGTSLGWKLRSKGEIAADELDGAMMVAEKLANGRAFVPATLRLTQRKSVSGGQTKRFVVPVLDFNLVAEAAQLQSRPVLEAGHTPIARIPGSGITLEEGLALADTERKTSNGRQTAPIPDIDDIPFGDCPVPVDEPESETKKATPKDALNVVFNVLRKDGHVTAEQMYTAVSRMRNLEVDMMAELIDGRKQNGDLSWAKLRDSLTGDEIANLLDRLTRLEKNVGIA